MGVYFASYLVYGLRIPEDYYDSPWDVNEDPRLEHKRVQVVMGGDFMGGEDEQAVVHHPEHIITTLDTAKDQFYPNTFGAFKVDEKFEPTREHKDYLLDLADELKVPYDIGFFVVTNVG